NQFEPPFQIFRRPHERTADLLLREEEITDVERDFEASNEAEGHHDALRADCVEALTQHVAAEIVDHDVDARSACPFAGLGGEILAPRVDHEFRSQIADECSFRRAVDGGRDARAEGMRNLYGHAAGSRCGSMYENRVAGLHFAHDLDRAYSG